MLIKVPWIHFWLSTFDLGNYLWSCIFNIKWSYKYIYVSGDEQGTK